jgi:hypothetical protein
MNIGMLWFDNDPKAELTVKVERAANYYQSKYGKKPTLCVVHPSMMSAAKSKAVELPTRPSAQNSGIEIRTNRSVLPNHFWIGINAAPDQPGL